MKNVTCPACGEKTLNVNLAQNALSRFTDAYVCSGCGTREAFEGYFWSARKEPTKVVTVKGVTQASFEAFVKVQNSGKTNMFDLTRVQKLSGLARPQIIAVINNYDELAKAFGKE